LLIGQNLTEIFGLYEYPGDDFKGTCEITIGLANINLKPKDIRQSSAELVSITNFVPDTVS